MQLQDWITEYERELWLGDFSTSFNYSSCLFLWSQFFVLSFSPHHFSSFALCLFIFDFSKSWMNALVCYYFWSKIKYQLFSWTSNMKEALQFTIAMLTCWYLAGMINDDVHSLENEHSTVCQEMETGYVRILKLLVALAVQSIYHQSLLNSSLRDVECLYQISWQSIQ